LTLGTLSAAAQTMETLQVTIPFAFTVRNVALPAGEYRISRSADAAGILAVQNIETRRTALFLPIPGGRSSAADQSSVAFLSAGAGYSLADIWWAGANSGLRVQSPHELAIH
jgi:hypothetical protein